MDIPLPNPLLRATLDDEPAAPLGECWNPGGPCPEPNDPECDLCGSPR